MDKGDSMTELEPMHGQSERMTFEILMIIVPMESSLCEVTDLRDRASEC